MAEILPKIRIVGDDSILIEYEEEVSYEVNEKVRQLAYIIEDHAHVGIIEVVPAYRSLMVFFDPFRIGSENVLEFIKNLSIDCHGIKLPTSRLFKIPTVYGGVFGPDLDRVSELKVLTPQEVIHKFSSHIFLVYFLGFLCSLPYLGGLPEILEIKRLKVPRPSVPVGSVGFAGKQAVVLPADLPSGFHYIGRTYVTLFDPQNFPPTPISPGDLLQFMPVSEEDAKSMANKDLGEFSESIEDY